MLTTLAVIAGWRCATVSAVPGVHAIRRVRSHGSGVGARVDVVVSVEACLSTLYSHAIADAVERAVRRRFAAEDVSVHVEPDAIERVVAEAAPESSDRS